MDRSIVDLQRCKLDDYKRKKNETKKKTEHDTFGTESSQIILQAGAPSPAPEKPKTRKWNHAIVALDMFVLYFVFFFVFIS